MFKIGQLVRIKDALNRDYCRNDMTKFSGRIAKITDYMTTYTDTVYKINIDNGEYIWTENEMEGLTRNNLKMIKGENKLYLVGKDVYDYIQQRGVMIERDKVYVVTSESELEECDIYLTKLANGFRNYTKYIGLLN